MTVNEYLRAMAGVLVLASLALCWFGPPGSTCSPRSSPNLLHSRHEVVPGMSILRPARRDE